MAGRPAYCRCRGDFDSRWILNDRGNVRCKNCNGAAPHNLVERAAKAANANIRAAHNPAPAPTPAPTETKEVDEKAQVLRKTVAVLNAKKEKDEATEATKKTRKVGKAKVNSKLPAKTGGVVTGQTGEGYIFADEPDRIYVVGTGWFGSWSLSEVTYKEPGDKPNAANIPDPRTVDVVINSINDWNSIGANLVYPVRSLKTEMKSNNAPPTDFFASTSTVCYGFKDGFIVGAYHKDDTTDVTWAVVPPMWDIL